MFLCKPQKPQTRKYDLARLARLGAYLKGARERTYELREEPHASTPTPGPEATEATEFWVCPEDPIYPLIMEYSFKS